MSSKPLLRKPREERKARNTKESPGVRCFLDAADLDSAIDSVSRISPWIVWKSESDHIAMISQLDYVIDVMKAASSQWSNTVTEARQIAILSKLETTLSASDGVPAKCLLMLAGEIEKAFPVPTTKADMQALVERYRTLKFSEFEGITVQQWCKCKLFPHNPANAKHAITYEAKLVEFESWIGQQIVLLKTEFYEKYGSVCDMSSDWQRKLPTMAECFRKGIGMIVTSGHWECLHFAVTNFEGRTLPAIEKKAALKWSAFGPTLCDMLQECHLPVDMFSSSPLHRECFEQVQDVVLPQFQFRLYRLRGMLEGQVKTVDSLKAKILAGMVSAAVASSQLAATYLTHMLQDKQL